MDRVHKTRKLVMAIVASCFFATIPSISFAISYTINVDTSSYFDTSASLAFDFIDGGLPSNSVTISEFSTDGTLGLSSTFGAVSGEISPGSILTLADTDPDLGTSFFNEFFQYITLGNYIQFTLVATDNPPDPSASPDRFSFFLLDDSGFLPLFSTTDPSGANSLVALDIDGTPGGNLVRYTPVAPVPEPCTLALLAFSIPALVIVRKKMTITR